MLVHACYPSYAEDQRQEDDGLGLAPAKNKNKNKNKILPEK
jgi:hypothetical protein